jgi:hypothetical protein
MIRPKGNYLRFSENTIVIETKQCMKFAKTTTWFLSLRERDNKSTNWETI